MDKTKDEFFDIWIEDGIVFIATNFEEYTAEMVEEGIKKRLELTKDKSFPMLGDIRKIKNFTREARQRLAQKDAGYGTKAAAILINSRLQEAMYNFFNAIYKAPAPAKMFTDKEKAIEWLQQFK
ncbi:MAG: STAS/SEC14 domain-containing protein [Bacteroidota bacterium]